MADLRSRARIPYGYRVADGKAVIHPEEASALRRYFREYLSGAPMTQAARAAGLPHAPASLPNLFRRKEYIGTDYYPPLISPAYQQALIREWEKRRVKRPKKTGARKAVRIFTDFRLDRPEGPAAELYARIRPILAEEKQAPAGADEPHREVY